MLCSRNSQKYRNEQHILKNLIVKNVSKHMYLSTRNSIAHSTAHPWGSSYGSVCDYGSSPSLMGEK